MAKVRFVELGAELDGTSDEIADILKKLTVSNSNIKDAKQPTEMIQPSTAQGATLPTKSEIVEMLKKKGKPFSFSLVEQQKIILGRLIDSRQERPLYSKFYALFKSAREEIQKNYGGKWITTPGVIDGHQVSYYTLVDEQKVEPNQILESSNMTTI